MKNSKKKNTHTQLVFRESGYYILLLLFKYYIVGVLPQNRIENLLHFNATGTWQPESGPAATNCRSQKNL